LRPDLRLNAASVPGTATTTARPIQPSAGVSGLLRSVRRGRCLGGCGELLQSTGRFEQLLAVDVRVACDCGEVGVAKVLSDEAGVAELLAEPGRGGVAKRVRGDVLLDPRALRGATDDVGEDRLLQPPALEPAEDGVGRLGIAGVGQPLQLTREARRDGLATRLAALPGADKQRRLAAVEVGVAPVEGAELGAA
jgi:hypothetical protein